MQSENSKRKSYQQVMWKGDNQFAQTPPEVWKWLEERYGNVFDPCPKNPQTDGLQIPWEKTNYVNPPYNECGKWMKKCVEETSKGNTSICLIPARTNTNWFHDWVAPFAYEIIFIRNGVRFVGYKRKSPFPVCMVVFKPGTHKIPIFSTHNFY